MDDVASILQPGQELIRWLSSTSLPQPLALLPPPLPVIPYLGQSFNQLERKPLQLDYYRADFQEGRKANRVISLGHVGWEIAVDRPTPDGLALEVEQCACPPGYIGTSCEDCAPGYERSGQGPYLGTCVPIQAVGQVLYWKLPAKFLGNKVTAYGGTLKYTFRFSGEGRPNQDPDVIIRGNDITLQYTHRVPLYPDRENTVELKIFEDKWQRVDGQQGTREHLLMALADLDDILIKVEQCQCPPGYIGTSCEDCAPGYSRTGGGLYLGLCERCECHGHASQCDKEYGFCVDCQHNTEGDQCERCKPGFIGDARRGTPHDCQPAVTRPPCHCNNHSPRGCDSFGRCLRLEKSQKKENSIGILSAVRPVDKIPKPTPPTNHELGTHRALMCAPGYTRSQKIAGRPCEPIGHVGDSDRTYVPQPPLHEGEPPRRNRHRRRRIRVRSRYYQH
ncbi:laminin B protein [Teladorsagia circumcincta]|uniref:Laminin B protein n=1 Tax=Teladorsagia circumcincta TaxID=45464 RepID=A0A2G9UGU0_TELCI|nr:laminin B protein [Teladorsagia circumcincta]